MLNGPNMIKIIFLGTPEICLPTLQALFSNPHVKLDSVVSMPGRKAGRGMQVKNPSVAQFALDHQIPLLQTSCINNENEFLTQKKGIDLIIVFAFAQFLSSRVLRLPKWGCFNIHTSLLPKYRGAAPIQYALLNGDAETGITIQKMVRKMDAGDIAIAKTVPIAPEDNAISLHDKLMHEAPKVVNQLIDQIVSDSLSLTPQDEANVSFASVLSKEEGRPQFASETFTQIQNRLRAFTPWPGTFCYLNGKRLKILEIVLSDISVPPGKCNVEHGFLLVGTRDNTIRIKRAQLEGKRPCLDYELLNGIRTKEITIS